MNELITLGKRRTILISISILIVSLHSIYYHHSISPGVEGKKVMQQVIRFALTVGLLYAIYKGKQWAKIVLIVLFALAIIGAAIGIFMSGGGSFAAKIPLIVMLVVYSVAIHHFGFSKSYKAFSNYQNGVTD